MATNTTSELEKRRFENVERKVKAIWDQVCKDVFIDVCVEEKRIDPRFEELGRKIVQLCGGLPLAVVLLGGILASKYTLIEWKMVSKSFNLDQSRRVSEVLALSYHDLPFKLKQCFLYLANFPNDEEINVKKLYHLWVAEGIVSTSKGRADEETMMDVAERYLSELAQRCMVQVRVKNSSMTGRFKSCRLHNLTRELCLSKAEEENFLKVMDFRRGNVDPVLDLGFSALRKVFSSSWKVRRLAIYSDEVGTTLPFGPEKVEKVRSLLFFYGKSLSWLEPTIINFKDFKFLRVLSVEGICQKIELPKAIGKLILLRYLSLRYSDFMKLPSSMGNLGWLQTLDLRVNNMRLKIPDVLWKMEQLRHLYLPVLYVDTKYDMLRLDGLSNLETLINFNSSYCDVEVLLKLTNLRKLQATLFKKQLKNLVRVITQKNLLRCVSVELSPCSFSSEEELTLLNKVLGYHHLYKLYICGRIKKLPEDSHFSPSLTKLVLSDSVLVEDPMPTLEKLPRLTRLAFRREAFVGNEMVCSATGFPQLESLELHNLPCLELWRVDKGAFSSLVHLCIHGCYNLKMVPDGLEFIATLQELEIWSMPLSFTSRLRVVDGEGEDFNKVRHVPNIRIL
ncbi:hypothetical protein F0562_000522 [Nyssa sinensis]|uniref:Uncharacterized protein n=1 Tax=Nyssa sinensis TaxID=561372 RepID=A0A5J5C0Q3_9ASTE|nr:hypothetical protein F0562_000522 [Nyssa sinensis]